MGLCDDQSLGYRDVDGGADAATLVDRMDETEQWDATHRLRAWERRQLRLQGGERLLDAGCGRGEAAAALTSALGSTGELVCVDASVAMLEVAGQQLAGAPCATTLVVGDARSLYEPDESFDVVRSERTLQWLDRPDEVVAEFVRVLRSGGRLSLVDTDWSTLHLDVGDRRITTAIQDAFAVERNRPSNVGRRLGDLAASARCRVVADTTATQVWTDWNPDETPAPGGCFSMTDLAADLVETGHVEPDDAPEFVAEIRRAAREHRFAMTLDMYAVVAIAD